MLCLWFQLKAGTRSPVYLYVSNALILPGFHFELSAVAGDVLLREKEI